MWVAEHGQREDNTPQGMFELLVEYIAERGLDLPVMDDDSDDEYDGEPYDIDSDVGYDPYAGGPEMDDHWSSNCDYEMEDLY